MKRPFLLRLPFRLLPVIAVLALLSCRAAVRRNFGSESPIGSVAQVFSNATLLRHASEDLAEAVVRRDVDELMEGKFPSYARDGSLLRRHHIDRIWRRENRHVSLGIPIRFHSFQHNKFFPELRRSLRGWWGNRRFQPEIMAELVDLVKLPLDRYHGRADSARRFASCAVVGNSGILLKNDYGELIDGHELVIRLNNARIHGYQRNVGSKTSLSFVNSNILHLCARRPGCFCHPYGENVPMIMYICQAAHFLDYAVCNSSYKAPLLITDIRFDMLCSRIAKYYSLKRFMEVTGKPLEDWAKFHDEKLFHYSSGMQAVMLALGICDHVRVFGFGKSAEAKHHYHTNQKVELDLHDYAAEYAFYQDLVDRPQVSYAPVKREEKAKMRYPEERGRVDKRIKALLKTPVWKKRLIASLISSWRARNRMLGDNHTAPSFFPNTPAGPTCRDSTCRKLTELSSKILLVGAEDCNSSPFDMVAGGMLCFTLKDLPRSVCSETR